MKENDFNFSNFNEQTKEGVENSIGPEIPDRVKLETVKSYEEMKSICRENKLEYVKYCNLFNNNLKDMGFFDQFTNIQTLILSFNEIKSITGLD